MPEKIGLEAVLEDANFQAGLARYMSGINTMDTKTSSVVKSLSTGYTNLGNKVLSVAGVMSKAVVAGAAAATVAVVGFGVSGVKAAADMESQVSGIAAVLNKTRDEIEPLNELILDLAIDPRLKVNATEAANAIELLARNGLDMTQIMEGAAFATVLLANATGAEFGLAADIATDAMAIFSIQADEMLSVVDSITSVTTTSKFTIDDYNLALRNGGAAAAQYKIPLEEFNAVVALSAEEMGSGMRAGTGFRNFLVRLTPNTDKASDAMRELGLITADGTNQFFNASGELKGMDEVVQILNQALFGTSEVMSEVGGRTAQQNADLAALRETYNSAAEKIHEYELGVRGANLSDEARAERIAEQQALMATLAPKISDLESIRGELVSTTRELTDVERAMYLENIFGQDALGTALALSNETGDSFLAMMEKMGEVSAVEAAETRMDNFSGALEILKGILEAIQLQVGNAFLPLLTEWTRKLSDLANDVGPRVVSFFERVAHAIDEFIRGATSTGGFDPLLGVMEALDDILPESTIDRIWDFIDTVQEMAQKAMDFASRNGPALLGALKAIGAFLAGSVIVAILAKIVGLLLALTSPIGLVAIAVTALGAAWESNFLGIQDRVAAAIEKVRSAFDTIRAWIDENRPMLEAFYNETWGRLRDTLVEVGQQIATFVVAQFQKLTNWFNENRPLIEDFFATVGKVAAAMYAVWSYVWTNVVVQLLSFWNVIQPILGGAIDLILGIVKAVMQLVTGDFAGAWDTIKETISALFTETLPNILTAFADWVAGWFGSTWAEVVETWQGIWDNVGLVVSTIWANIKEAVITKAEELLDGISDFFTDIRDEIDEKLNDARQFAEDAIQAIKDKALDIIRSLFDLMGIDLKKFTATWSGYLEDIRLIAEEVWTRIRDYISTKVTEMRDAISEKWTEISTTVSEYLSEIWTSIIEWVTDWYEAGVELVTELKNGAVEIFEQTVDETETRVQDIIDKILEFLEPFLMTGRDIIWQLWNGIVDTFELVVETVEEKVQETVDTVTSFIGDFLTAGSNLIGGLIDGVLAKAGDLIESITGAVGDAIAAAKALLGIESPSKIFEEIGINIGLGLIEGILSMKGEVENAVGELLDVGGKISSAAGGFVKFFEDRVLGVIEMNLTGFETELADQIIGLESILGKEIDVDNAQSLVNEFFAAIASGNSDAQAAIQKIWELQGLIATEKQKQVEAEGELYALQLAQQELSFLQQQLDLLDLIKENGLNADEILGGIQLGLGADISGVVQAMTAAMNQIIFAAQAELQIASPSKVMEHLGQMTMQGFRVGVVEESRRAAAAVSGAISKLYSGSIQPILSPLVQPSVVVQPAPVNVSGGNTYQLSTMTNETSMSVQQSFKLMQMTEG